MSSLQDLLVNDLEARNIDSGNQSTQEVVPLDLGFVEKVAQSVEGIIEALAAEKQVESDGDQLDLGEYLKQKVASVKQAEAAPAGDTAEIREHVLQKLAHLTPEAEVQSDTSDSTDDANEQIKGTLEGWVSKIKEASAPVAPKSSPASVKTVLDLVGGGTDE